jgi:hypothetical protein
VWSATGRGLNSRDRDDVHDVVFIQARCDAGQTAASHLRAASSAALVIDLRPRCAVRFVKALRQE